MWTEHKSCPGTCSFTMFRINFTIKSPTRTLKVQGFDHKWQDFGPTKVGAVGPTAPALFVVIKWRWTCPGIMKFTRDNKLSFERKITLALGQSSPRGSSLPQVYVNGPSDSGWTKRWSQSQSAQEMNNFYSLYASFEFIVFLVWESKLDVYFNILIF